MGRLPKWETAKPKKPLKMVAPKQPTVTSGEMDLMLGMKKQGRTQKEINEKLIIYRKDTTGKTYKNLTNIVSKVTSQTERGEKERAMRKIKIEEYTQKQEQYDTFVKNVAKIQNPKKRAFRERALSEIFVRPKGRQIELVSQYDAETDDTVLCTPPC